MTIQMEPLQQYFQRVHEVKIFESIKTQTKNELFRHLNRTSLVSKEFVKWPKRDLSLAGRLSWEIRNGRANQSTGILTIYLGKPGNSGWKIKWIASDNNYGL